MDNLRMEQLKEYWDEEDLYGEDWREDLTPEELDYVASLDRGHDRGVLVVPSAILILEKIRAQFTPSEIQELERGHDHYRLRLRDGHLYLARLDKDRQLRLDEIDEVCLDENA